MGVKENEELVRTFFNEVGSRGNLELLSKIVGPDYVCHDPAFQDLQLGVEGVRRGIESNRRASRDLRFTVDDLVSSNDKVVVRWTMKGTFTGDFMRIPAEGKTGEASGISIYRIVDGKLAECWQHWDDLGLINILDP